MLETSHSLLERMRHPKADSWPELVELYTPLLRGWIGRYDDIASHDVDDLVQDVLLTVSQELPKFEHNNRTGAFRAWLRKIVVNRLRNFWRSRNRRPDAVGGSDFLQQMAQLEDDNSSASQHWDREHDRQVMNRLIGLVRHRFADNTWNAFQQHVIQGRPAIEVAGELNLSRHSVHVAKARVIHALRQIADGLVE